ncbi:hypothetical protein HDU87_006780 [Geranomyces variabilis]|uniref:Uncharacterized protein n=1 Tax=Geranomyces variabilis TaxID=109894 RepID=A0AAD5TPT0_9FUNG|nr:hypothetical protein HDU87_006780 [Geranomyces variabilis]
MLKLFTSLLLLTAASAAPVKDSQALTKRWGCWGPAPSSWDVQNAINTWQTDINVVNAFLNNAPSDPTALYWAAQTALTAASNENGPFKVLAAICDLQLPDGSDGYSRAVNAIQTSLPAVVAKLQDVVNSPADPNRVGAVASTDLCCQVLPSVDFLFCQATANYGIKDQVPNWVARPNACENVNC